MDDKFVRLRLFKNKPHHPFAQIHKLAYCKRVHWYGWTKVVAQTRKSFSGAVYTMDHDVVPRKRPILHGTTSWDDFHGPSY
jgi:hypothetical protein